MKVDAVVTSDLDKAGAEARELEEMGYDGLKSVEISPYQRDAHLFLARHFAQAGDRARATHHQMMAMALARSGPE